MHRWWDIWSLHYLRLSSTTWNVTGAIIRRDTNRAASVFVYEPSDQCMNSVRELLLPLVELDAVHVEQWKERGAVSVVRFAM